MVTLEDIRQAREVIGNRLHHTPLVHSTALGARIGAPLFFKLENWQKTGSFKPRGVLNKISTLDAPQRARGLVTASAGNHAQALAWASAAEGLACTVVMPETASPAKLAATRGYGAEVVLEPSVLTVISRAQALAEERGLTFVSPFDDPAIIAGHGTAGLEIVEDLPEAGTVVVAIGGGGLIAGVAAAVKQARPGVRVVGVEPEGAASMWHSRRQGHPIRLDKVQTIADGLAAPYAGQVTFPHVQAFVDDLVLVTDDAIRGAMALLLERCKILAEPAGAASLAALLKGVVPLTPNAPVVAVISGGNVDIPRLVSLLADLPPSLS